MTLRKQHPAWGSRKIARRLQALGCAEVPAASTITEILRRHAMLDPAIRALRDFQRFEQPEPNDLWQMDFKGHFAAGSVRCHPLTVLDDHSRYALGIIAFPNERTAAVRDGLSRIFTRYGLPYRMLMDNGSPWGDRLGSSLHAAECVALAPGRRCRSQPPLSSPDPWQGRTLPSDPKGRGAALDQLFRSGRLSARLRSLASYLQPPTSPRSLGHGRPRQPLSTQPPPLHSIPASHHLWPR